MSWRANLIKATRIHDEAALDPHRFTREAYRQNREYRACDGHPPNKDLQYVDDVDGALNAY